MSEDSNLIANALEIIQALLETSTKQNDKNPTTLNQESINPAATVLNMILNSNAINIDNLPTCSSSNLNNDKNGKEEERQIISKNVAESSSISEDDPQDLTKNALKLFDEAMSYKPPIKCQKRVADIKIENIATGSYRRKYNNYDKLGKMISYPRQNYNTESKLILDGNTETEQFSNLHQKLENERNKVFDEIIKRDVDRLLTSATRIYGYHEWTSSEKQEFEKYCRILRTKGTLTIAEKEELKEFYAKAYNLKEIKNSNCETDYVFADDLKNPQRNNEIKHNSDDQLRKSVEKTNFLLKNDEKNDKNQTCSFQSISNQKIDINFTVETIGLFKEAICDNYQKARKRGRPRKLTNDENSKKMEKINEQKQICDILKKVKDRKGCQDKVWTIEEKQEFERFFKSYKEKKYFSKKQIYELHSFFKTCFEKKLKRDEVEAEKAKNQNELITNFLNSADEQNNYQESENKKREYWKIYRQNYLNKKRRNEQMSESEDEEKRKRKAAYLIEWRVRKAQ